MQSYSQHPFLWVLLKTRSLSTTPLPEKHRQHMATLLGHGITPVTGFPWASMLGGNTISSTVKRLHSCAQVCHIRQTRWSESLCSSQSLGVQEIHLRGSPMGHESERRPNIWLFGGSLPVYSLLVAWWLEGKMSSAAVCLACFLELQQYTAGWVQFCGQPGTLTPPLSDNGVGKRCKHLPLQALYNRHGKTAWYEFHHGVCGRNTLSVPSKRLDVQGLHAVHTLIPLGPQTLKPSIPKCPNRQSAGIMHGCH